MYVKVFATMYTGSMLGAGADVFAVWTYILACSDEEGSIEINPEHLAFLLGAEIEDVEQALQYLQAEDPKTRTSDENGRRIIKEGRFQYRIVNHEKYRDITNKAARRRYNARKQAEYRARKKDENEA